MPAQLFFFTFDCIRSRNQYLRFVCGKKKKIGMLEQLFLNLDCIDADRPVTGLPNLKAEWDQKFPKKKSKGRMEPPTHGPVLSTFYEQR
jgi:hypothetical protein